MQRFTLIKATFPIAAIMLLASCSPAPQLYIDDVVLKLSPVDSNPSVMYFKVEGGPKDVYLEEVVSSSVIRSEMHESGVDPKTGEMSMTPLDRVLIPAKGKVEFKQGGKHVMMWGVNLPARRLGEIKAEFVFSNGDRLAAKGDVVRMDGTKPDQGTGH